MVWEWNAEDKMWRCEERPCICLNEIVPPERWRYWVVCFVHWLGPICWFRRAWLGPEVTTSTLVVSFVQLGGRSTSNSYKLKERAKSFVTLFLSFWQLWSSQATFDKLSRPMYDPKIKPIYWEEMWSFVPSETNGWSGTTRFHGSIRKLSQVKLSISDLQTGNCDCMMLYRNYMCVFFGPLEPCLLPQNKKKKASVSPGVKQIIQIACDFCRSFC